MTDTFEPDATQPAPLTPDDAARIGLALWSLEAYDALKSCRTLLAQLAPAAPLLDELDALIERAEEPWPTEISVQPDGPDQPSQVASSREGEAAPVVASPGPPAEPLTADEQLASAVRGMAPEPLVPEHQQDELYDPASVVAPAGGLAEFTPPAETTGAEDLDGPVDVVAALALMLVLCRLLLENNGSSAAGGFVNEALSIVEELWGKVDGATRAAAEAHASTWEEKAGW